MHKAHIHIIYAEHLNLFFKILTFFVFSLIIYSTITICFFFKNPSPEEQASFLSHLLFTWFDKLAWKGFKKPLEQKDLWDMNPEDSSRELVPKFEKYWQKSLQKCERY